VSISLSLADARRLAVTAQLLATPEPPSLDGVMGRLGRLQMDPTSAVARAERLVLWSRMGVHDPQVLDRALWGERSLFEYWAFIVPVADFGIHRETMRRYPRGDSARARYEREWLSANAVFRRYVLANLRRRGPLRSRDLENRAAVPWRTGGWNDGKSVGLMLELLWHGGRIATVGRTGQERIWDLAERVLPVAEPRLPQPEVARQVLARQLRARGVDRSDQFGFVFDGRPPGWERALRELVAEGTAVPASVDGLAGDWLVHREALEDRFHPRTTLLSPFEPLIKNRDRTEELFGFRYRLEIYVPREHRQFGYYVLPILHGDRLIGRIDPLFERKERRLRVHAIHAEPEAPPDAGADVARAIGELASWLGATEVALSRRLPARWRAALRASLA
jgi:uncharacterized protein